MQLKRVGPSPLLPAVGSLFRSIVPAPTLGAPAHVTGLGVPLAGRPEGRVGWKVERSDRRIRFAVWCAVGDASSAADTAQALLDVPFEQTPASTLAGAHVALFGTDGAVAAVVDIDLDRRELSAATLGDVTVIVAADSDPAVVPSQPGVLGVGPPPAIAALRSHRFPWEDDVRVLVHTAGIEAGDDLAARLTITHPVVACSTLVRDHRRPHADVCVVAARIGSSAHEESIDGMMSA